MNNIILHNFEQSGLIKSKHSVDRYIKLITHFVNNKVQKIGDGSIESHHILPKAIWTEYRNENWNIVNLPTRWHYVAHLLLYKALKHNSCAFALNQMRRCSKSMSATQYAKLRNHIIQLIKQVNTGKIRSLEQRKQMSLQRKGKTLYKNPETNEHKRFPINEQPENWILAQCGRKHSNLTKARISRQNSGRKWWFNPDTNEVYFSKTTKQGFVNKQPDWYNNALIFKNLVWTYDPVTMKAKRLSLQDVPENWEIGRNYNNVGFQVCNDENKIKVIDINEKKYILIDRDKFDPSIHVKHGKAIRDVLVYEFEGKRCYSFETFKEQFPFIPLGNVPRDRRLLETKIPKPNKRSSKLKAEFYHKHESKPFGEIGITITSFIDHD